MSDWSDPESDPQADFEAMVDRLWAEYDDLPVTDAEIVASDELKAATKGRDLRPGEFELAGNLHITWLPRGPADPPPFPPFDPDDPEHAEADHRAEIWLGQLKDG